MTPNILNPMYLTGDITKETSLSLKPAGACRSTSSGICNRICSGTCRIDAAAMQHMQRLAAAVHLEVEICCRPPRFLTEKLSLKTDSPGSLYPKYSLFTEIA